MKGCSYHYLKDRQERRELIKSLGSDKVIYKAYVDRNGSQQVHYITSNGVILIYDKIKKILITKYIARPNQIKRLYESNNKKAPNWLLKLAYEHKQEGLNA